MFISASMVVTTMLGTERKELMEPNKERIQKLVDALRSGKYQQAKRSLRTPDGGFCCLGVACDIYGKENGVAWDGAFFLERDNVLPLAVDEWYGFGDTNPELPRPDLRYPQIKHAPAAALNDEGLSFTQIADLFEQKYLK